MAKTANKAKASTSSPSGTTKKAVKANAVASAAKKGIKANPVAALKKSLKGKSPLAAGKPAAYSSSGQGSAQKSEANLVNTVCRQVGLKRNFSFSYFRENLFSLFAKKAYEKLRK
jgi:hypothetical protein